MAMTLPNLELARFNLGWTQEQLAQKSGLNRGTIIDLERGRTKATSGTARKLADALGVEVWQLQSNEGSDLSGQGRSDQTDSTG